MDGDSSDGDSLYSMEVDSDSSDGDPLCLIKLDRDSGNDDSVDQQSIESIFHQHSGCTAPTNNMHKCSPVKVCVSVLDITHIVGLLILEEVDGEGLRSAHLLSIMDWTPLHIGSEEYHSHDSISATLLLPNR